MNGDISTRYANAIVSRSKLVIVLVLVLTAAVTAGAVIGDPADDDVNQFEVDSAETDAQEVIEEQYGTDEQMVTQIVVRDSNGDVLTQDSLLKSLQFQQEISDEESIHTTLSEDGIVGIENVVATAAVFEDRAASGDGQFETSSPTLDEQIDSLASRSESEFTDLLETVLDPDGDFHGEDPAEFLPTSYEPGSTEADSRITFVFHSDDAGSDEEPAAVFDAQLEIESLFEAFFDDGFVFGEGITDAASASAIGDSFTLITPVALVLILFVLAVTYRDVVDVLIGLFGIGTVMAWIVGLQGWLEIPMDSMLIAVPFLLVGLSIDYSLHVVMRYREAREGSLTEPVADETNGGWQSPRAGMGLGLAGVVLALAAATVSTGIGFLSNVLSPLPAIQNFALLSAGGILATFVAFGVLIPAIKVEVDELLETRFGRNRAKEPFGTGTGIVNRVLLNGVSLVRKAPVVVILVALVLAVGGAYGATGLDTEFNQADFLPEDAPDWTQSLPGPLAPDTYTISEDVAYLGENFQDRGPNSQAQILLTGNITDPSTLVAIENASQNVSGTSTIDVGADGTVAVEGPTSVLQTVASENESVAAALDERDTTGDGLPNEDVEGLYDVVYDVAPDEAASVLHRTADGEYESARLIVSVRGDAASQDIAADVNSLGDEIETSASVSAVATGGPVTTAVVQDALLETLIPAFTTTVVVILVFLTILYWVRHRELTLGAITLAPVVAALAWLLGAMALLDVPFNTETIVMTSLAIGLGVDYSIHVGERFIAERQRQSSLEEALTRTVVGTGGALLGSAATTAAGFGVLALALSPPLQRFGIVTGLSIMFAFVACLTVLPCLLLVRERLIEWF
ncbi:RND superfamily permease [Natrialba magadii ATCC 43099]|uniref:RND superfamily permease n=1 Tax=Natrialba magadii (strain ATCC 43099 / DSM 3394 / CCM 3739 / CIP 104546 / IAM 13178 / JCM 8861 / NBRC 102185 / NCIMB 2190 / MS3) TaxID=547559 RepID=D3SS94_NATMM|nr:MMPL family transporter [Natrialba magadii]ADD04820.1 RND superfamily permease [Natrialba magadii ATCC 43099]ELY24487.1 hypothetical protein C500_18705 [Natrialba magadii ATCC 43099]